MFRLLFSHPQVLLKGCKLQGAVRTFGIPNVFTLKHKQFICIGVKTSGMCLTHTALCKLQEAVRTLGSQMRLH